MPPTKAREERFWDKVERRPDGSEGRFAGRNRRRSVVGALVPEVERAQLTE